jgi:hypothetical protein
VDAPLAFRGQDPGGGLRFWRRQAAAAVEGGGVARTPFFAGFAAQRPWVSEPFVAEGEGVLEPRSSGEPPRDRPAGSTLPRRAGRRAPAREDPRPTGKPLARPLPEASAVYQALPSRVGTLSCSGSWSSPRLASLQPGRQAPASRRQDSHGLPDQPA